MHLGHLGSLTLLPSIGEDYGWWGGEFSSRLYATDLWSTSDGESWRQETDQFAWPPRLSGAVVVFKNKVWIMGGGRRDGGSRNDIWTFEAGE